MQRGNPETTWDVDPTAVGRLGLIVTQVSEQLSDAWLGDVKTELRLSDRTIPVRVRYPGRLPARSAQMAATPIRAADGRIDSARRARAVDDDRGRDRPASARTCGRWRW